MSRSVALGGLCRAEDFMVFPKQIASCLGLSSEINQSGYFKSSDRCMQSSHTLLASVSPFGNCSFSLLASVCSGREEARMLAYALMLSAVHDIHSCSKIGHHCPKFVNDLCLMLVDLLSEVCGGEDVEPARQRALPQLAWLSGSAAAGVEPARQRALPQLAWLSALASCFEEAPEQ
jgi:hypothetical protein